MEQKIRALFDEASNNPIDGKYVNYDESGPILRNYNNGKPYSSKTVKEGVNRLINQLSQFDSNMELYELIEMIKNKPLKNEDKLSKWINQSCSVMISSNRLKIKPIDKPKIKIGIKDLKLNKICPNVTDVDIKKQNKILPLDMKSDIDKKTLEHIINQLETKKNNAQNSIISYNKIINDLSNDIILYDKMIHELKQGFN